MANKVAEKISSSILSTWQEIRSGVEKEVEKWTASIKLEDLKGEVQKFVKNAELDIKSLVDTDLDKLLAKIKSEKETLESVLDRTLQAEIEKAKSFIESQRLELEKLQRKVESYIKLATPAVVKKATKKVATKSGLKIKKSKKPSKKSAKKAAKKKLVAKSKPAKKAAPKAKAKKVKSKKAKR